MSAWLAGVKSVLAHTSNLQLIKISRSYSSNLPLHVIYKKVAPPCLNLSEKNAFSLSSPSSHRSLLRNQSPPSATLALPPRVAASTRHANLRQRRWMLRLSRFPSLVRATSQKSDAQPHTKKRRRQPTMRRSPQPPQSTVDGRRCPRNQIISDHTIVPPGEWISCHQENG